MIGELEKRRGAVVDAWVDGAVDASPERRPGVPMESEPPAAVGSAHWTQPARQRDPGNVLRRADLASLTPVFGGTLPPRGLSGLLRRAAYRIPEHDTSHWLVLLLADRVDVVESRLPAIAAVALAGGAFATLAFLAARKLRTL